ncbi:anti-sigma B factor RsbW [Bacillus kwashiorkori]|uniref:anti-sigma B factor RsbW n=1 Tax=Bacillus kwashiorkori TaxID=1522318 RepID=UPI0007862257|nr:anti-sigma B factor RsbW [Bacillus kwashiorkori]
MNQPTDIIELKLPPKPEYVGIVRLTLSGIASRMGFCYEDIEDIKIAVSEAITNAVQHAYKDGDSGDVMVKFRVFRNKLKIDVLDRGDSFDYHHIKQKKSTYSNNEPVESMREGGLGLFLIETLMDEVEILRENGCTIVCMAKFLEREQVERDAETISTS